MGRRGVREGLGLDGDRDPARDEEPRRHDGLAVHRQGIPRGRQVAFFARKDRLVPDEEAAYRAARRRARTALASESVLGIRATVKDVREARQALGGKVVADKSKLARFEAYLFNDTGKYAPEPSDGIAWNNDTGVKMTVRNVQVLTDRPAR